MCFWSIEIESVNYAQSLPNLKGESSSMQQDLEQKLPCRSVFKDGRFVTNTESYTRAWITLINQTERNKNSNFGAKNDKNLVM